MKSILQQVSPLMVYFRIMTLTQEKVYSVPSPFSVWYLDAWYFFFSLLCRPFGVAEQTPQETMARMISSITHGLIIHETMSLRSCPLTLDMIQLYRLTLQWQFHNKHTCPDLVGFSMNYGQHILRLITSIWHIQKHIQYYMIKVAYEGIPCTEKNKLAWV